MVTPEQVKIAREVLAEAGYAVENLWQVGDVESEELTDTEKLICMNKALANEATMEQIRFALDYEVEDRILNY